MNIMSGDIMFLVDKVAQEYVLPEFHQFLSTNHHNLLSSVEVCDNPKQIYDLHM
jgi:hypothetical protein